MFTVEAIKVSNKGKTESAIYCVWCKLLKRVKNLFSDIFFFCLPEKKICRA